jgi:preprotein translocase subunit SecE
MPRDAVGFEGFGPLTRREEKRPWMAPTGPNPGPEGSKQEVCDRRGSLLRLYMLRGAVGRAQRELQGGGAMRKLVQFVKESYAELRKVVWPGKDDVISSVKVVLISTVLFAAALGLVDVLLLLGVQAIF